MKRLTYSASVLLYACLALHVSATVPRHDGHAVHPPNVVTIYSDNINDAGNNRLARFVPVSLTESETSAVRSGLKSVPDFPANPYSGCHARAHVVYQTLNKASGKLFKVWLLSGSLLSPALSGSISYPTASGGNTSWQYHVAAAYVDKAEKTWVLDTILSREPMPVSEWVRSFKIDGVALYVQMAGESYLFNKTEVPPLDPCNYPDGLRQHIVARNVLNGNFYTYTGLTEKEHRGAQDLAADALAAFLIEGKAPGCGWVEDATATLKLKDRVLKTDTPAECQAARALYQAEFERWVKRGL